MRNVKKTLLIVSVALIAGGAVLAGGAWAAAGSVVSVVASASRSTCESTHGASTEPLKLTIMCITIEYRSWLVRMYT